MGFQDTILVIRSKFQFEGQKMMSNRCGGSINSVFIGPVFPTAAAAAAAAAAARRDSRTCWLASDVEVNFSVVVTGVIER